ncbi:MAG: polynucleotide adenylyltransferase PcnB [Planctomycetaceae bacterium]|nr:polynucleotide adenylyltransferase PcnB [Planctomycetaceae bacterium]
MNADITPDAIALEGDDDLPCTVEALPEYIEPVVRIREEHNISRRDIDPDALKVLYRLARNNYIAYLVGGGVRDLLLGRKPKDFDVSTNAKPEQIRSLFKNCILIGRRFRLAHIRYGEKIIETSTFRTTPKCVADPTDPDADLFQRDDNLFGTPQEDALRRDFTVNGLFYDIESFSIIDYVGGMEDLAAKRIRCIGDPCIRFREDPVRMIRAIRFASRLGFTLDPDTEDAIHKHGDELAKAAPARLLEEITRLFAFASGEKAVRLLHVTGLLRVILPEVADCIESDTVNHDQFWNRLEALDKGDTVLPDATPALIFAVLLLDPLKVHLERVWSSEDSPRLRFDKVHSFLEPLALRLRFPRKLVDRIVHMYLNQHRFCQTASRGGKRGSLANFVTTDAFHESLALAEIIVTAEGGQQSRLNQWRDMLAERIYGKDDAPGRQHHGRDNDRRSQPQGENRAVAGGESQGEKDGDADITDEARKLSRSARRRRNKRMKRSRPADGSAATVPATGSDATPPADAPANDAADVIDTPAAVVAEPAPVESEKASENPARSRGARRGRGRKKDTAESPAQPQESGEPEAPSEEPKPLTAAAFWSVAEPEPEPEPEKPAKKRGGRKKADPKKAAAKPEEEPRADEPLRPDRADEADTPMHWLDEI